LIWILTILAIGLLLFYCGFLTILKRGFSKLKFGASSAKPVVSVIVPARNEEKYLPQLIGCLQQQTYPADLTEIILVDDRSSDKTGKIIQKAASSYSPKKWALLKAIEGSKGEIIMTTDADSLPGKKWIQGMVQYYEGQTGMVLGYAPYMTDNSHDSLFHKLLALEYFALGAVTAASVGIGHPITANGANFSFKRKIFQDVGGYGETLKWISGDDDLFLHRVNQTGRIQICFSINPDTAVVNRPPANIKQFIRQRIRFASKHLAYPKGLKILLALIYTFYMCLTCLIVITFFNGFLALPLLFILGVKTIFELLFLRRAQQILKPGKLLRYYPLAVIPHIFYIVIFPILGQLFRPRWK